MLFIVVLVTGGALAFAIYQAGIRAKFESISKEISGIAAQKDTITEEIARLEGELKELKLRRDNEQDPKEQATLDGKIQDLEKRLAEKRAMLDQINHRLEELKKESETTAHASLAPSPGTTTIASTRPTTRPKPAVPILDCSAKCRSLGLCTLQDNNCVATTDADCKQSAVCRMLGACRHANASSRALRNDDCKHVCDSSGRCTAKDGECIAATDTDCERSYGCKSYGQCTVKDGESLAELKIEDRAQKRTRGIG